MQYMVVIEKSHEGYDAYVPDLPGCVSAGSTLEEVKASIRQAIELHLEGLREDGMPIPPPTATVDFVDEGAMEAGRVANP